MSALAPGQIWYLLKFLLFPTRFLAVIATLVVLGLLAAGLTHNHNIHLAGIFYLPAAMLFTFLLIGLVGQFSLLTHRKTLTLCGSFSAYLSLISAIALSLWCLVIAAAVVVPMENFSGFWRMSIILAALLSLGIFLGALTRLNLFLIAFVVLAVSQADAVFAVLGNTYRQGSAGQYGVLLALTAALWICLYQRIKRGQIPTSFSETFSHAPSRNKTPLGNPLVRLLPALRLGQRVRTPGRILLLESRRPWLLHFTFNLLLAMVGASVLALLFLWLNEPNAEFYRLLGGGMVAVPALMHLGGVGTIGANLRRLWLLVPGSREELFRQLERALLITAIAAAIPFTLASAGLLTYFGEPLWWSLSWALYVVLLTALLSYLSLLTLAREHSWVGLIHLLISLALWSISLPFWSTRNPAFVVGVMVPVAIAVPIFRALATARWAKMDYSQLKNRTVRL